MTRISKLINVEREDKE